MAIVKSKNKKTGITYVYSSESYWCPEKKQPRNRRTLIGKLDDEGNIVPTGKRGRKKKEDSMPDPEKQEETKDLESALTYYQDKSRELETQNALLTEQVRKLEKEKAELAGGIRTVLEKYK